MALIYTVKALLCLDGLTFAYMYMQIHPACNLLEQATKDISSAEKHLKGIFDSHKKEICKQQDFYSTSIPAPPSSPILAEIDTAFLPNPFLEANDHAEDWGSDKARFDMTPRSLYKESCLPTNSTHAKDYGNPEKFQPCALDFNDSSIEASHSSSTFATANKKGNTSGDKWQPVSACRNNSSM